MEIDRLLFQQKGTSEHPEELTDRCCLSALAGLSKYLPFFGAGIIIPIALDMSTFFEDLAMGIPYPCL